jgi:hypothetical protein
MAVSPSQTYLLIPLLGKDLTDGVGIRCKSIYEAETWAFMLGYRKFKIVEEVELVSVVRDKNLPPPAKDC